MIAGTTGHGLVSQDGSSGVAAAEEAEHLAQGMVM
jgi:hypothetical protein